MQAWGRVIIQKFLYNTLLLSCLTLSVAYGGAPTPPTTAGAVTSVSELPPSSELAGPVPQYRLEPRHRGISPQGTKVDSTLSFSWKTEPLNIGSYPASRSSPAVDETAIYIGADDGQLYALNREDGSTLWTFKTRRYEVEMAKKAKRERKAKRAKKTKKVKKAKRARNYEYENHGIHGTPAFDHEYVYIGDYSGWMYALDKKFGWMKWEHKLGGSIGASPTLFEGKIFISVEYGKPDGKIFVLDAEDGEELYSTNYLGQHPHSSTSIDPSRGYMFVGANNGVFFCFDYVKKAEVWRYETGGAIKSTAAVTDDTVFITSWDRKIHAINIETGDLVFEYEIGGKSMSSPSYHNGRVYFGSHDGALYAVNALNGELVWKFDTGRGIISSPTIVQDADLVLIGSSNGRLYGLALKDGAELWRINFGSEITSVPVAVARSLLVNDQSGVVWRFDVLPSADTEPVR